MNGIDILGNTLESFLPYIKTEKLLGLKKKLQNANVSKNQDEQEDTNALIKFENPLKVNILEGKDE